MNIPLQPTRKENNWETEEAMERSAVTLETERVKWPNPGCLWWWWIFYKSKKKKVTLWNTRHFVEE